MSESRTTVWVAIFAAAFGAVEAAVVVYLRALYYPQGFALPLKIIQPEHLTVELAREFATIVMLAAVGAIAGKTRWSRFAYFAIAFGVWDIFYYVWLKVALDWPASLLDWDILFLIPVPWLGPVIAPVLISVLLIIGGLMILRVEQHVTTFSPGRIAWVMSLVGCALVLASFVWDVGAIIHQQIPAPFRYDLFVPGFVLLLGAVVGSLKSEG